MTNLIKLAYSAVALITIGFVFLFFNIETNDHAE